MKSFYFRAFSNKLHLFTFAEDEDSYVDPIQAMKDEVFEAWGIPAEEQTLYSNGRLIHNKNCLENLGFCPVIDVNLKLHGGKGGFGSLLRGQAKSNKKITNFDASRDLQGRRIRNVKLQQKLIEWAKNKRKEDKETQKEVDEYNKKQKEIQGVQRDIRLTQEFKDKVEKWDHEMSSSIRAGAKKARKKKDSEAIREEFQAPVNKKIVTEMLKAEASNGNNHTDSLNSRISEKLANLLKSGENNGEETSEPKQNGEITEKIANGTLTEKEIKETPQINGNKEEPTQEVPQVVEYSPIDLKSINSKEELVALGAEHLKKELMRLGLKCGGSLQEKAKRLYDIKLKPELLFDPKYIAKK